MMSIFKAYDIRGIYPGEINDELMEKIGKAFANFIKGDMLLGHDMRISSQRLFNAFKKGVKSQGVNITTFGLTSTPMSYFASNFLKSKGTAMITASHNPKEYNGVKFTREEAIPVSGESGIKEIEAKVNENNFSDASTFGSETEINIKEEYKKHLLKFTDGISGLKVVIDASNGMGAQDYQLVQNKLGDLGVESITTFMDLDGNFPNHDANPMKPGAADKLIAKVKESNADLGIIFDGDADRIFFVDDNCELIPSDFITALVSEEVLKSHPGSTILYDLRSSWIVPETIEKFGGFAKMSRVGHSFIKEAMRKENSIFAGELSGHFYFKFDFENHTSVYDSGIVMALFMMRLLSSKKEKLSKMLAPLKKYYATGEINSKVENKDKIMKNLEEKYSDGKISHLDGIRIDFDDFWFNVRPSNTEPLLRLCLEAKTKDVMEEKRDEVLKIIRS